MAQLHRKDKDEAGRKVKAVGTPLIESAGSNKKIIVPVFTAMFLAVTLVLLLACANVGNLLLARAAARRNEIAIRLSLGGSRTRLVRQLLVESFTLALTAAAVGLAIAWIVPTAIVKRMSPDFSLVLTPDLRVCAYTAGVAILACVVFGLAPALHGTRAKIDAALRRDAPIGSTKIPLRTLLLAAQVAISVILLTSAGLLVRGVQRAQHQDPGFRINDVLVAELNLPAAAYSGTRQQVFTAQLEDALAKAADLPSAGVASNAPLSNSRSWTTMRRSGDVPDHDRMVEWHEVNAAYFDVLGIPIVAGRNFTRDDVRRNVVLLNETAAHRFWGAENAVGKSIDSNGKTMEVIGIVKDAFTTDLNDVAPAMYWPVTGRFEIPKLLIAGATPATRERISAIIRHIEPRSSITFTPLTDNFQSMLQPAVYAANLAGALGVLALALAGIGMSGVFAYMVRQRTREIGVRMALGARPVQVIRLVLASNLRPLAWGALAGLGGALATTRLLKSMMAGITAFDPLAYAGVLALLLTAAAAAGVFPARRASQVDPVTALRWD